MATDYNGDDVSSHLDTLARECYVISASNGFHDDEDVFDEHILRAYSRLALIHTEVAEATEELRHHEIDWVKFADELADIIIRTVDLAQVYDISIGDAVKEKVEKNRLRPYKHGKAF
jgi:NTP pyrophosphatase (non-canonical NTP hydrolase)